MRRLFWIGVGVGLTVLVIKQGRRLVAQHVPPDAAAALGTAQKATRTARGVLHEFAAGVAEREQELRAALVGDADPAQVRERGRTAWAELRAGRKGRDGRTGRREPGVPESWAGGPLEDPDDDDGYAFF